MIFYVVLCMYMYYLKQVMKIVRVIRNGWIKFKKDDKVDKLRYYLIWDKEDDQVCIFCILYFF